MGGAGMNYYLTVSARQAYCDSQSRDASRVGLGRPEPEAHKSRANVRGFFMGARKVLLWAEPCGREQSLPVLRPVDQPARSLPTSLGREAQSVYTLPEDSNMANTATPPGEIRPISLQTALKRLRRHLAKISFTLHCTRPGTAEWARHGQYFIRDDLGNVFSDRINLESRMRSYGLLADIEVIL